jgi:hypothetical protein
MWGLGKIAIKADPSKANLGKFLSTDGGYTFNEAFAQTAKKDFLESPSGVCMQGSGMLEDGRIIHCSRTDRVYEWGNLANVRPFETVARCQSSKLLDITNTIEVDSPWFSEFLAAHGNQKGLLQVTDNGQASGLCSSAGQEGIDVYFGVGQDAYDIWKKFISQDSDHEVLGEIY